jgi:hypothetical protein
MKLICIFAVFITLSLLTSNITAIGQTTAEVKSTAWATASSGNVFFLDRHQPNCKASNVGSALSYFYLDREANFGGNIRYEYSCIQTGSIAMKNDAVKKATAWDVMGNHEVNFLDRHHVNCPNGQVLRDFKIERNGQQIRYTYHCVNATLLCCKDVTLAKNDMGNKSSYYLDRNPVGTLSSTKFAIKGFKLNSQYTPDKIWYTYTKCQVQDDEAAIALSDVKRRMVAAVSNLQDLEAELSNAKALKEQLESQVANVQSNLQTARNNPGLKTDC